MNVKLHTIFSSVQEPHAALFSPSWAVPRPFAQPGLPHILLSPSIHTEYLSIPSALLLSFSPPRNKAPCIPGWPRTHYGAKYDLELLIPKSSVLKLEA